MNTASHSADAYLLLVTQRLAAGDLDSAERVARHGRAEFPAAHGFELKLGEIQAARGALAEAFYYYQWELLRAGSERQTGDEAAMRSAQIFDEGHIDEVQRVMEALQDMANQQPQTALQKLEAVRGQRGDRFVLRMYIATARHHAGEMETAESGYRELLRQDDHFVPAYIQLAGLLRARGRTDEAAELEHRARDIDAAHWSLNSDKE